MAERRIVITEHYKNVRKRGLIARECLVSDYDIQETGFVFAGPPQEVGKLVGSRAIEKGSLMLEFNISDEARHTFNEGLIEGTFPLDLRVKDNALLK